MILSWPVAVTSGVGVEVVATVVVVVVPTLGAPVPVAGGPVTTTVLVVDDPHATSVRSTTVAGSNVEGGFMLPATLTRREAPR
ncbi:MAG: hypothetical protein M3065_04770 [Actinomycetota bacterium]|nr:hypothetical protein [Actinomycetota bacterium]